MSDVHILVIGGKDVKNNLYFPVKLSIVEKLFNTAIDELASYHRRGEAKKFPTYMKTEWVEDVKHYTGTESSVLPKIFLAIWSGGSGSIPTEDKYAAKFLYQLKKNRVYSVVVGSAHASFGLTLQDAVRRLFPVCGTKSSLCSQWTK